MFPLKPIDQRGNPICVGDKILVLKIPDSLIHDMNEESRKVIEGCKNQIMKIYELDEYGFAWLEKVVIDTEDEYIVEKFALEPEYLEKIDDI